MTLIVVPEQRTEMKPLRLGPVKRLDLKQSHPTILGSKSCEDGWNFKYKDQPEFEDEINDFFNHHDFDMISHVQKEYQEHKNDEELIAKISNLTSSSVVVRIKSANHLVYYSLGCFKESKSSVELMERIKRNNRHLSKLNIYPAVFKALRVLLQHFITFDSTSDSKPSLVIDTILLEISIYQTLLYVFLVCAGESDDSVLKIEQESPFLPSYLAQTLSKLAEGNRMHFPIKKHILLVLKANRLFNESDILKSKNLTRILMNYRLDTDLIVKANEYECNLNQTMLLYRYPSIITRDDRLEFPKFPISAADKERFLSYYDELGETTDLSLQAQLEMARSKVVIPPMPQNAPFPWIPIALKESMEMHYKYLYQTYTVPSTAAKEAIKRQCNYIDSMNSQASQYLAMLVRLLFYLNIASENQADQKKQSDLEHQDLTRHKEIVTFAISEIILMHLKSAKRYHVLEFERMAQILTDDNLPILILKMLSSWFAMPPSRQRKGNSPDEMVEFDEKKIGRGILEQTRGEDRFLFTRFAIPKEEAKQAESDEYGRIANVRNFKTSINLLRILQNLTKNKKHRILAMVQWKSSAVLKRILRVNNIDLKLYALKLLKSQIPYLGKKWKSNNMPIISMIYLNLRHRLKENYLAGDQEITGPEASPAFQNLKESISNYMAHKESETKEVETEGDLDVNFMSNYQEWLKREVYHSDYSESGSFSAADSIESLLESEELNDSDWASDLDVTEDETTLENEYPSEASSVDEFKVDEFD